MNLPPIKLIAGLALAVCGAAGASAQILVVNVDFNELSGTYSGQGAYSDTGNDYWNGLTNIAGGSNFTASDGVTVTGISASFSGADGIGWGGTASFASDLMSDYLYTAGSPVTFSISGLTPGAQYQFYFYSQAGNSGATDRHADFTFDGNLESLTAEDANAFILGTNYVVFTIAPGGTTLNGSFAIAAGNGEAELNGFQIVQVTAIPEPSTYALLGGLVALIGAGVWRRTRSSRVESPDEHPRLYLLPRKRPTQ